MTTQINAAGTEPLSMKNKTNDLSEGMLVLFLLGIVISSFNAGMMVSLGLRHAPGGDDSLRATFLSVGCFSLLVAAFQAVVVVLKSGPRQAR